MTIWIVRKHPPAPYGGRGDFLKAFEIVGTYATSAEAKAYADNKKANRNTLYHYSVGKVSLKARG
jgi:hypothetical protein